MAVCLFSTVLRWLTGPLVMIRTGAFNTDSLECPTRARFTCCGRWRSTLLSDVLLSLSRRLQVSFGISQSQSAADVETEGRTDKA
jgi:hypothetical protein